MKTKTMRKKIITLLYFSPILAVLLFFKQICDGAILWYIHRNIENGSYANGEQDSTMIEVFFNDIEPNILAKYIEEVKDPQKQISTISECAHRKKKDMLPFLKEIAQKNIGKEDDNIYLYSMCAVVALEEDIKLPELEPNTSTPRYNQMSDYYRYLKKVLWAWDGKSELEPLARQIAKDWKPSTSNSECEKLNGPLKPNFIDDVFTKTELGKILYIGMNKNNVIKRFGTPTLQKKGKENKLFFTYLRKPILKFTEPSRIEGFSVDFKDDKVTSWNIEFQAIYY